MSVMPAKPRQTAADYMVIALSPALIMVLVGSLCFFLIDVFYRGQMAGGVRWVMFWFVLATVLVSRIAIEKSPEYAALYGLALAATVWLYLVRTQPAHLLGIVLLAVVWFCANKLVWDCTLIDDDEDASGQGLLQSRPAAAKAPPPKGKAKPKRKAASGSPGVWVVYFSLAVLPLFGIGQVMLPADDTVSRRMGLVFLVFYMAAALGLLITTSFLGLRRYLRQRYLRMPPVIALAWLKLGGGVALFVLAGALLLPRPGSREVWTALRYQVNYRLRQASQYASPNNPPGTGEGRAGNEPGGKQGESKTENPSQEKSPASSGPPAAGAPPATPPPPIPAGQIGGAYHFLRSAFLMVAGLMVFWWLVRCRYLLLEMFRSLAGAVADSFRKLLDLVPARRPARRTGPAPYQPKVRPLAEYKNPFYAGKEHARPPLEIILYTFDAVQAWALQQGREPHPEQTAREFCRQMAARSPELAAAYRQLSFLYGYAAYGKSLPADCDLEPLKEIWRQFTWHQANAPAAA
jgi:chromate transport protein ChrA